MVKKNIGKDEKRLYLFVIIIVAIIFGAFFFYNYNNSITISEGKYEVLDSYCTKESASVDMESLGNREKQITSSLISLYHDCKDRKDYYITILEPTKECFYDFNGEVVRLWYEGAGEDYIYIPNEAKAIIESDTNFIFWEAFGNYSSIFEAKNGILKMEDYQISHSHSYRDYLKNGLTKNTLISIIDYEGHSPYACE